MCLYIFLVGISSLSKSISGLTTPNELTIGDMAQLKEVDLIIDNKETLKKKIWVKITHINKIDGFYSFEYSENSILIKGKTTKDNIKILFKNDEVKDVTDASDHLNIQALSKPVYKYYICYPKK